MKIKNCEICNKNIRLDVHHIQSTCFDGKDEQYNKANICPNCHRSVHTGDLILEGRFAATMGNILVWRKKGEKSITGSNDPKVYLI